MVGSDEVQSMIWVYYLFIFCFHMSIFVVIFYFFCCLAPCIAMEGSARR